MPPEIVHRLASLADLVGADGLLLVAGSRGVPRVVAGHPADGRCQLPAEAADALRSGRSHRAGQAGDHLVIEPVERVNEEAALVARFSATPCPEAADRLRLAAAVVSGLLDGAAAQERVRTVEAELVRMRTRLRELTRAVASGIASVDLNGRIQEINAIAAEILGVPREEAIGRHFGDFVAPEDLATVMETFATRAAGYLSRQESEVQVVRADGERRLVQFTSSPLLEGAEIVGVYFAARDVTEERVRDVQLRRAERLASLAPLLGGVCHELNNPLTSIKSFAELMLLDERPADDVEALQIVRREAARAARIVSDLKLVARQTQEDARMTDCRINDLVTAACDAVADDCAKAGVRIRCELDPELPRIGGKRAQLERLLAQLLTNAAQALAEHAGPREIEVRTYATETGLALRIHDTGPGIPPEYVERIFDPFWTTRTTGEGTGLGLSLAHGIVSDHGGSIAVDGGWGTGATFTVELPCTPAPLPAAEPSVQAPARQSLRILVVDDEAPIRYTIIRYMSRRGHTVREAEEGAAALAILEARDVEPFDVILADIRMPGLRGDELFERLRARGDGLEERLILITGDAEGSGAAEMVREAGVPIVQKPFELAEIAQIIEAHAAAAMV